MATQWQDRYTELEDINSGNEIQNGDSILGEHVTYALENTEWVKKRMALNDDLLKLRIGVVNMNFRTSRPNPGGGSDPADVYGSFQIPCLSTDNLTTMDHILNKIKADGISQTDVIFPVSGVLIVNFSGSYIYFLIQSIVFNTINNTITLRYVNYSTSSVVQELSVSTLSPVRVDKLSF